MLPVSLTFILVWCVYIVFYVMYVISCVLSSTTLRFL